MLAGFLDTRFCLQIKTEVDDGYGNSTVTYTDGKRFMGGLASLSDSRVTVAEQGLTAVQWTLVTPVTVLLCAGDRVKRETDGALFEVISYGADGSTPACATASMRHAEVTVRRVS